MKRAAPVLLLGALTLVCFWPVFRGDTLYDVRTLEHYLEGRPGPAPNDRGDTILSLPMLHRLYGEGLHSGELRLWNPLLFCGYPAYNNLLLHPFYPPNLVLFALFPPQLAYDLGLLLHFLGSGLAMAAFLRGTGRSAAAGLVGALLWMLQGYFLYWFSPGTMQGLSVFLPLALLGLQRAFELRDLRPACLGGAALGLAILGSHGQHALLALLFCTGWIAAKLVEDRSRVRTGAAFVLIALGVGLAAILTQLDSVLNGVRIPGGDFALHYASPLRLPTFLLGAPFGRLHAPRDPLLASEFTIHVGFAGAALAAAGLIRGRRDPWIRFLGVVAGVSLLVAFLSPLASLAASIPLLNLSMPARWVYLYCLAVPILAARGFDELLQERGRLARNLGVAFALLFGLTLLNAFRPAGVALLLTLLGAGLAVAACLIARRFPGAATAAVLGAILLDLLPGFLSFNRHAPSRLPAFEEGREARVLGSDASGGTGPFAQDGWRISIGANLLALRGFPGLAGYESIAPAASVALAVALSGPEAVMGSGRVIAVTNLHSRLLDLAAARHLHMPFDHVPGGRWVFREQKGRVRVYENPDALPRAFLADPGVIRNSSLDKARQETFDPREGLLPGGVSWIRNGADELSLECDSPGPAMLVIADTHYPGWTAQVDGRPADIHPAYSVFRAVDVPAGKHRVTLTFRPLSARLGLGGSLLCLVIAGGIAGWPTRNPPTR